MFDEISLKDNIKGIIIKLGSIKAGFGKRKEIYNALMRLKNNNKEIIVYSDKYDISKYDYYLISMADTIYSSHHTAVDLKGINMEMTFLRGLLDTVYIVPEVIRVSPYKSAGDALLNKKMSEEVKENYGELLNDSSVTWDDGPTSGTGDTIFFGAENGISGYNQGWDCGLTDIAIFNEVKELSSLHDGSYKPSDQSKQSGLVGYWRMEEGSGTTVEDSSGNGNHGTLTTEGTGIPTWTKNGSYE